MAINKLLVREVVSLTNMTWVEKAVRSLIQFRQHGRGWTEWPIKKMAEELGISRSSFTRAVESLAAAGWLEVERHGGRKNRYRAICPAKDHQLTFPGVPKPASGRQPAEAPNHPRDGSAECHEPVGTRVNLTRLCTAPDEPNPSQSDSTTRVNLTRHPSQSDSTITRKNACNPGPANDLQRPISPKTTTKEEEKRTTTKEATSETGVVVQKEEARKALLDVYQKAAAAQVRAAPEAPAVPRAPRGECPPAHMLSVDADDWREVRRLLRDWGAPAPLVAKLTWQCRVPPSAESVARALEVADRYRESHGGVLKNPTGFILEALKGGWE